MSVLPLGTFLTPSNPDTIKNLFRANPITPPEDWLRSVVASAVTLFPVPAVPVHITSALPLHVDRLAMASQDEMRDILSGDEDSLEEHHEPAKAVKPVVPKVIKAVKPKLTITSGKAKGADDDGIAETEYVPKQVFFPDPPAAVPVKRKPTAPKVITFYALHKVNVDAMTKSEKDTYTAAMKPILTMQQQSIFKNGEEQEPFWTTAVMLPRRGDFPVFEEPAVSSKTTCPEWNAAIFPKAAVLFYVQNATVGAVGSSQQFLVERLNTVALYNKARGTIRFVYCEESEIHFAELHAKAGGESGKVYWNNRWLAESKRAFNECPLSDRTVNKKLTTEKTWLQGGRDSLLTKLQEYLTKELPKPVTGLAMLAKPGPAAAPKPKPSVPVPADDDDDEDDEDDEDLPDTDDDEEEEGMDISSELPRANKRKNTEDHAANPPPGLHEVEMASTTDQTLNINGKGKVLAFDKNWITGRTIVVVELY